jgi:hypothetical protein
MNVLHDDYLNHTAGDPKLGGQYAISLVVLNIFLIYSNLSLLNKCIQYFEPIYIIPLKKVALMVNTIMCGGIILDEFKEYDLNMVIGVVLGALLCGIGVSFFIFKRLVAIRKNRLDEETKRLKLDRSSTKEELEDLPADDLNEVKA